MRDALLYCAECGTVHPIDAVAAGNIGQRSRTCRATELEAMIESATEVILMAARSGLWGIAEEGLDVVLGLNDAESDVQ